jgi:hypothetical protein
VLAAALAALFVAQMQPASPAPGGPPTPASPPHVEASPGDAVIVRSASTNSAGYTIVVHPDYSAELIIDGTTKHGAVPAAQAKWLFEKLAAAGPLEALAARHCMKSASFGTSLTVSYRGQGSPDLSCGGGDDARELARTAAVIAGKLGVPAFLPRRPFVRLPGS